MAISRRDLIRNGLVALSVGVAAPHVLIRSAHANPRAAEALRANGNRALIVVELAGGNDGINTLIPYADENYYRLRPTLGIKREDAHVLTERVALHPSLGKMHELYQRGRLAVVQGAGYPNFNFSHFRALEIYRSGDTGPYTGVGWLGRYLDSAVTGTDEHFAGLSIGAGLNPAMYSEHARIPAVANAPGYTLATDPRHAGDRTNRLDAFTALNRLDGDNRAMLNLIEDTANAAYASSNELQTLVRSYASAVEYPNTDLGNGLKLMAQVVTAGVGLQVGYITVGGFDHHADQVNVHRNLLGQVSDGIAAFLADMEAHGIGDRVLVMTMSEFGRRPEENGSRGTDHGSAQPIFLAGAAVKGGVHSAYPSLTDLDNRNLKMTVDFRQIYATIIKNWLGADPTPILKGSFDPLDLLA